MVIVAVFDLDMVLQKPAYPHPALLMDVSAVVGVPYDDLHWHYSTEFSTNQALEEYHISLCRGDQSKIDKIRGFWQKMHWNMDKATLIPGAKELLEEAVRRGWKIFAWTKGSVDIQRGRLQSIGLSEFFPEGVIIYSPRKGTVEGLREDLLPNLPEAERRIMFGDSYRQDISPALEVGGFTCIWIRWEAEVPKDADLDDPNLIVVESTQELVTKIKEGLLDDVQDAH